MPEPPPTRVFLVGFPRSGTTLLQSLLAAHPDVLSLPETFFFVDLVPGGRRWRLLDRAHPRARSKLSALGRQGIEVGDPGLREALPVASASPTARRFVRALDASARRRGKRAWVEKTPSHLHHLEAIERHVPEVRVVHMVRAGVPAIASLRAVTEEHPEPWGGVRSLEDCVGRWRADLRRSHACVGRPNHSFVSYERLVADPPVAMGSLAVRLGLRADAATIAAMVGGYGDAVPGLVAAEPWKASVGAPIENRNGERAARMFSPSERERIEREIAAESLLLERLPFA
jgi:hypothetical protein